MNNSQTIPLNPKFFRPNSSTSPKHVNFLLQGGGIGDFIGQFASPLWIAKNHPQVLAHLYVSEFFLEIPKFFLKDFPNWEVLPKSQLTGEALKKYPTFGPSYTPINGTGSHFVDLGFIYYCGVNPPPADGNYYPQFPSPLDINIPALPEPYVVMTPGTSGKNREMPAEAFNAVKAHLLGRGITPVFLGKTQITDKRKMTFPVEYDLQHGINLIDQTSLLQAARIIQKSKLIIGLDNGLLHLAGMTTTPMVFGYTIASPEHRRPRRPRGEIFELYPDPQTLPCTFCQSQMRFMFTHDFAECVYKDNLCIKELASPLPWIQQVDEALKETT